MTSEASADRPQKYTPTPREAEALAALKAAREAKKPSARLKVKKTEDGAPRIEVDHEDQDTGRALLRAALGTTDSDFSNFLIGQLAFASVKADQISEIETNFLLSVIKGIQPRDQLEAMLAAQAAATHVAAMRFAQRLANAENIPQQDSASNTLTKLTRTFAAQMQTLKNYRSNGEQKVTVQHVNVAPGAQAIVGNVSHGAPANDGAQASPAALPAPVETPLTVVMGGGVAQRKARVTP